MNKLFQIRRSVAAMSLATALAAGGALTWWIASSTHTAFGANNAVALVNVPLGPASFNEGFSSVVEPLIPTVVITPSTKLMTLFKWRRIGRGVRESNS